MDQRASKLFGMGIPHRLHLLWLNSAEHLWSYASNSRSYPLFPKTLTWPHEGLVRFETGTFRKKYFYFYLRIRWGIKKVQKVPKKKYFFGKVLLLLPLYKTRVTFSIFYISLSIRKKNLRRSWQISTKSRGLLLRYWILDICISKKKVGPKKSSF